MAAKKTLLLRYALQLFSLLSFIVLLAVLSYPPELDNQILQWFSRFDPWLLLSHFRWQQEIPSWSWLPFVTVVSTLLWGRLFCGWMCPFGGLLMVADKLGRLVFPGLSALRSKVLCAAQPMRRYWFVFLAVVFVLGSNWVFFFTPFVVFSHEIVRALQGQIPWVLLGILFGTLLFSRLWCSVLCPTGVLLSLAARRRFFRYKVTDSCVQCGKCKKTCPVGAAPVHYGTAQEGCFVCGDCQKVCPARAIEWKRGFSWDKDFQDVSNDDVASRGQRESRRNFFKVAFTVAVAAALWRKTVWAAEKTLRPPGALPEPDFTAVCNRCGRCVQVCPANALQPMPITEGLANFETPQIIPRKNRCDLCLACQKVCPTGAIVQVPLEKIQMGKAVINHSRCIAWNEDKLCYICGEQCPVLAITADEQHRPIVQSDKCVGCGSCENGCPVNGEAAIRVFPQ